MEDYVRFSNYPPISPSYSSISGYNFTTNLCHNLYHSSPFGYLSYEPYPVYNSLGPYINRLWPSSRNPHPTLKTRIHYENNYMHICIYAHCSKERAEAVWGSSSHGSHEICYFQNSSNFGTSLGLSRSPSFFCFSSSFRYFILRHFHSFCSSLL